jgi:hypothetical protein
MRKEKGRVTQLFKKLLHGCTRFLRKRRLPLDLAEMRLLLVLLFVPLPFDLFLRN